jgi:hypothetical protein
MRLRLLCAVIGAAILPAFDLADRVLWQWQVNLSAWDWPLPAALFLFLVCPGLPLLVLYGLGGAGVPWVVYALVCLINGVWFALIGPPFWRLVTSIKASFLSKRSARS